MSLSSPIPLPILTMPIASGVESSWAELGEKSKLLSNILRSLGSVVLGFSGGVDSTYLLFEARRVLGKANVLAVIGISETYPERELKAALLSAEGMDVDFETVRTEETDILKFAENPPDRCYYCKSELFDKLEIIRDRVQFAAVLDGTNLDDLGEFRPGKRANQEHAVRSPLAEAQLTKAEIRELSKRAGLATHDKPSFACLSSRFPYHTAIDRAKLKRIDQAEQILHDLGFRALRVRYHDDKTARIEVPATDLGRIATGSVRDAIVAELKELGFVYITLDLEGFRSGSMNEVLTVEEKQQYLSPVTG